MKIENVNKILAETPQVYNMIAETFSDTRGKWWRGMNELNKYAKAGDKVLDLGCGNGRMAEIFTDSKIEYLGIDNSEELIKIAAERFKDQAWAKFEAGDVLDDLPKGEFDLVLLIAVLHHLPTKELRLKVLENIFNSLKPGGRLVMLNWNLWQVIGWKKKFRYWRYLFDCQEKIKRGAWGISDAFVPWKPAGLETMRFIHSFKLGETKRLLKRAGFVAESVNYVIKGGVKAGIIRGDNSLAVAIKK